MVDKVSENKRSEIMKAIKSKDTKIELKFRKALWRLGFRYRKNAGNYFGKPDLVFKRYGVVIFIDSCFWHGCEEHCRMPSTRKDYWIEKIERNKRRDTEVNEHYEKNGWKVLRIWEHDILNNLEHAIILTKNTLMN